MCAAGFAATHDRHTFQFTNALAEGISQDLPHQNFIEAHSGLSQWTYPQTVCPSSPTLDASVRFTVYLFLFSGLHEDNSVPRDGLLPRSHCETISNVCHLLISSYDHPSSLFYRGSPQNDLNLSVLETASIQDIETTRPTLGVFKSSQFY